MKFGLMPGYGLAPVDDGEYATGFGRLAEDLGFESVWAVEHVVMPDDYASIYPYDPSGRMPIENVAVPDPLTWLTWVASATQRLKLGTAILILAGFCWASAWAGCARKPKPSVPTSVTAAVEPTSIFRPCVRSGVIRSRASRASS